MERSNGCCFFSVSSTSIISTVFFVVILILVRAIHVIYRSGKPLSKRALKPVSTLIILGSGGHTAEMLNLLTVLEKDRFILPEVQFGCEQS
ncbi:uncharacterized protein [Medicago truncatula]|uniref:UDP-N-acetylglucosamine transferase subunit ALG14 n=1 Tax=Medicago truncatula TaxID=3880 RepID=G7KDN9_MEDTR|nr:uncharacterized protein LOC11434938 [Medicago truncatula]AES95806.2 ALG14-like oligosaccharide biosynthesis protein [Medicago truncatula]